MTLVREITPINTYAFGIKSEMCKIVTVVSQLDVS